MFEFLSASLKIWLKSLFVNAVLVCCWFTINGVFWIGLFAAAIIFIGGAIITSPLVAFVIPLLKYSLIIPYSQRAQRSWLAFGLMLVASLFYVVIILIFRYSPDKDIGLQKLIISTYISIAIAVARSKKILHNLSHQ